MRASAPPQREHRQLLERLTAVEDDGDLRPLLGEHAREPSFVEALCAEATKLLRVDVRRAERIAALAGELAEELADPYLRGRSRRARANVLHVQGEYEAALAVYEEALEIFDRLELELEAGITRSSALQTLAYVGQHDRSLEWADAARRTFESHDDGLRLGRLDLNLGTIVYRQERFEEARQLMERGYDRLLEVGGPADVAHCLRNLATVHIGLKNFTEAEDVYARARDYCLKEDLPLLLGEIDYNIAYLYYLRGEYTTAIELYRKTRERCEATGELYHQALCDLDEAEIYLELNLIDETLRCTDAAFRSFERLGMRYEAAKALAYLAIARIRQGKTILGLEIFDQARQIFAAERNETWLAVIDLYKALALTREGRRFEAEGLAAAAESIFAAAGLEAKVAATEALRARLRLDAGDTGAGRELARRALDRLAQLKLPALACQVQFLLGRIEERAGNAAGALAAYEAAHRELARSRSIADVEELKIPLLDNKLEVYESLVSLLASERPDASAESVFGYIEIAKARNLVDLLARRGLALPTRTARSAQVERVRRLREELNWYYRRIDIHETARDEKSPEELAELRQLTLQAEDALAASLREVEVADPEFAALQTASAGRIEEIRGVLPAAAALVQLFTARDTIYACVLDRHRLGVMPLSLGSRVREIHTRYNDQLLKFRLGDDHVARFGDRIVAASREVLNDLYRELIEPLEEWLAEASQLVFVPHGSLHWLPFAALHDGGGYLADRFEISYAPTATVYLNCCQRRSVPSGESLLMAVPDDARTEAEELARELDRPRVLLGAAASEAALRQPGNRHGIVHLATRANFRSDNPMFSSIELGDGWINLFDLYGLRLDSRVTVLSGCGQAASSPSDGDELLGLARGLLYSGSRSVLLPLWNSPPEVRTDLLASFYRSLKSAPSRAAALNRAMLAVKERHEHPYYWASFALIGDPGS